jgi:hypothetical protein
VGITELPAASYLLRTAYCLLPAVSRLNDYPKPNIRLNAAVADR